MKNLSKNFIKKKVKVLSLFLSLLLFTFCVTISNVIQPSTATIGEVIDVTLDVDVAAIEDASYNVILGILMPEDWDASTIVASYTSPNGNGTFSLAPDNTYSKQMTDLVGIGENYGRVKWVSLISDGLVSGVNNAGFSGQVQISFAVGDENVKTQLGYVVGETGRGITLDNNGVPNYGVQFPDCFEVTGGSNILSDLCGPIPFPVTLQPSEYSFDDVIKINFDASKGPTALLGAESIFLCGAVTADGVQKEICEANPSSSLTNIGPDLWEISIWGKQFFDLPRDANITAMNFYFRNENGDIVVKNPDTGEDFQITPNCSN